MNDSINQTLSRATILTSTVTLDPDPLRLFSFLRLGFARLLAGNHHRRGCRNLFVYLYRIAHRSLVDTGAGGSAPQRLRREVTQKAAAAAGPAGS